MNGEDKRMLKRELSTFSKNRHLKINRIELYKDHSDFAVKKLFACGGAVI